MNEPMQSILDRIQLLRSRFNVEYKPREHTTGFVEQNFGCGVVPLRHALWILDNLECNVVDGHANRQDAELELAKVAGILFSFAVITREDADATPMYIDLQAVADAHMKGRAEMNLTTEELVMILNAVRAQVDDKRSLGQEVSDRLLQFEAKVTIAHGLRVRADRRKADV